ncbi:hypothetical protein [Halomarina pelagica]|uniref:hypothetical protein n=1 Tax=Halomarina pelagica TaxID=2961599 RepID=UPI0020C3AA47|nr:hypothetical protein [Halomarina sp. BND7]
MTDHYLPIVLEEAHQLANHQPELAQSTEQPAHEYLRYAVLQLLEADADDTYTDVDPVHDVTVGYGMDQAMFDHWASEVDWWESIPPQENCTRFRIFYSNEQDAVPRTVVDVMAALGAWHVWTGEASEHGSYDHCDRHEVHYLWPKHHPIEELLTSRLQSTQSIVESSGVHSRNSTR